MIATAIGILFLLSLPWLILAPPAVALGVAAVMLPVGPHHISGAAVGCLGLAVLARHALQGGAFRVPFAVVCLPALWYVLALMSLIVTEDIGEAAWQIGQMIAYFLVLWAVVLSAGRSETDWLRVAWGVVGGAVVLCSFSLIQELNRWDLGVDPTVNYVTFYAVIGCLALPLGLWPRYRWPMRSLMVVLVLFTIWTSLTYQARAGIVQVVVVLSVAAILYSRRLVLFSALAAALFIWMAQDAVRETGIWRSIVHNTTTFSSRERGQLYLGALRLLNESPLLGHGVGSTTGIFERSPLVWTEIRYPHSHSAICEIAVELGWPGLVYLAALFGASLWAALAVWRSGARRIRHLARAGVMAVACVIVESTVEALFYNSKLAFLTVFCLGLALALPGLSQRLSSRSLAPASQRAARAAGI